MEPFVRTNAEKIPLRFAELEMHNCKNLTRIYWAKDAVVSYGSFTIARPRASTSPSASTSSPTSTNPSSLFEKTFSKECSVPMPDAKKVAARVAEAIKTKMVWDFSAE